MLAKILPDMYINVMTNGPDIALAIAEKIRPAVTLCGGVLNRKNRSVFGYSCSGDAVQAECGRGIHLRLGLLAGGWIYLRV